nr:trypsin-like peptidase domain-containing protein [Actinomadura rubrisoli]
MLVADGLVLTAAHTLTVASPDDGPITVRFLEEPDDPPVSAQRADVDDQGAAAKLDVALLRLESTPGPALPVPIELWPALRCPTDVHVFGYPLDEGPNPHGIWRRLRVAGPVRGGMVQLDWNVVGTLIGHSGGPVCDSSGLMVGILVAGSEQGRFDRMVPVQEIRRAWSGLPRPWLMAGENARGHFVQRAAGQRSAARGGDLFRGRVAALHKIQSWLRADVCPGVPLVVTAQPGAGKSAVVARVAVIAEQTGENPGVAFHARGAREADLTDAISAACRADAPESASWKELVQDLADRSPARPLVIIVDALDEAVEQDIPEIRAVLRDLARLDWIRVIVATRELRTSDPYLPGGHLHGLGVTRGPDSQNVVDLDSDRYFEPEDLRAYASALLTQTDFAKPGPAGAAWETYRQATSQCTRLAGEIAKRAGRNYLVAGMAAFQLAEDPVALDARSPDFDSSELPSGVGEALAKHLERLSVTAQRQQRALLTALAYGRGSGLDDHRWLRFAKALGYEATMAELDVLRESAAVDYLLETAVETEGTQVTRLFHQALVDELLAGRNVRRDESRLLELLRSESADGGWLAASRYARHHAPDHAARAGTLPNLLAEPDFLVGMAPGAMRSAVRSLTVATRAAPGAIYDLSVPFMEDDPGLNSAILQMVCSVQGNENLAGRLADLALDCPWRAAVRLRPLDTALARFEGHADQVWSATVLSWPGMDHHVLVTTSEDGTAQVWDPLRPESEFARFGRHTGPVQRAATLPWPDMSYPAVVTTSADGTARVWDPLEPDAELARFDGHTGPVSNVTALTWPGLDRPVLVTTSADGTARVWDPLEPDAELARFDGHAGAVWGVATLAWPGLDHPVVATTSADGTARVWNPLEPEVELARFQGHTGPVSNVTTLTWPGLDRPVLVTTSADTADGTARVWDPLEPGAELARFQGHSAQVRGIAALTWPGLDHPVVVTASTDGTARVWDPLKPDAELARFDGHTGAVWGVATMAWPGLDHSVVVSASEDGTARVWDPRGPDAEPAPFDGHAGPVEGLATLPWPGLEHFAVVTTSVDRTARVWDPLHPDVELARFEAHTAQIRHATALAWPGLDHPVVVTTSADRTARVWDPLNPHAELARFDGHTERVQAITTMAWPDLDHHVIATASHDRTARVWDPLNPDVELARFDGHGERVQGITTLPWPDLNHSAIVTTSFDATARVWDPLRPNAELARFDAHTGPVRAVLTLPWPGLDHPVVVTTSDDGTARIWDPLRPNVELGCFDAHSGRVWGATTLTWPGLEHPAVITTSADATARVWDPRRPDTELARVSLISTGYAVVVVAPLTAVVSTSRGFIVVSLKPTPRAT